MEEHQSMVMTVKEVAAYLKIPRSSVYKIAQEGKIPCRKVGRRWRFHREAVDRWLAGGFGFSGDPSPTSAPSRVI